MTTIDRALVRTWFDVLYVNTPGLIHVCATGNWTGRVFTDHDQAADYVVEQDAIGREGIYLRVTTLAGPLTAGARGSESDAHALPGLWADIDIAGPGHKTDQALPPDIDSAQKIITESGLPTPSIWVHSGGGLYPWWLLDDATDITTDNINEIRQLSQRWQNIIARSATRLGYHYGTGVGDLARVLRIPGTINRKAGLARPCTVLSATANRHSLDDLYAGLATAINHLGEDEPTPAAPRLTMVRTDGSIPPGDDFEARCDWTDDLLLGGAGWRLAYEKGGTRYWRRPGKDTAGISATTGRANDRDRLFVFSDATEFTAWHPHTKFGAYATLHHGGDHSAAARALRKLDFGTPTPISPDPYRDQSAAIADLVPGTNGPRTLTAVDGTSARVIAEPQPEPDAFGPTEDGLARALVAHHGDELRYCPQRGKWLRWARHLWRWDEEETHRELARQLARQLPDSDGWRTMKKRGLSASGVAGIVRLAQSDAKIVIPFSGLDSDPWVLNTPDGVIDLRTGKMAPPNPDALCTRSTSCAPDPDADQSLWLRFLADTFGQDHNLIAYLQRLVGYSAVGAVGPHVLPFCFGSGGNGKGVFLEAIAGVLDDYATTAPVGFLMAQAHIGHETEIARLAGARMVICSEVNEDDSFDEAKVKQLTGGDTLTARFMRQDHFTFAPSHQLWLVGNHKPAVRSGGRSFWRRLRLVPFEHEVPENQIVDDLQGVLVREHGPAILAWIAEGAAEYHRGGLQEPDRVKDATAEYAKDQDTVTQFVEEQCHLGGGQLVQIKTSVVREAYEQWCYAQGERPVTAKAFGLALKNRFGVGLERSRSARFYVGVTLLAADESDDASGGRGDFR